MTLVKLKPLHLAKNLDQLDEIANKRNKNRTSRLEVLCKTADRLFVTACSTTYMNDDEIQYVYYTRYINLVKEIIENHKNSTFIFGRFGKQLAKANDKLVKIKQSLEKRYAESRKKQNITNGYQNAERKSSSHDHMAIFKNKFISPEELYDVYKKGKRIIVWDARSGDDYKKSHIKHIKNINIPSRIIRPGFSAYVLGQHLPPESVAEYNMRDEFHAIILMDWKTDKDTFCYSVLSVLSSIITNWDLIKHKHPPYVLFGGYLAWLDKYPSMCTDPNVYYDHYYEDLDDLLSLETMSYSSIMLMNLRMQQDEELNTLTELLQVQIAKANSLSECYSELYSSLDSNKINAETLEQKLSLLERTESAIAEDSEKLLSQFNNLCYNKANIDNLKNLEQELICLQIDSISLKEKIITLAQTKYGHSANALEPSKPVKMIQPIIAKNFEDNSQKKIMPTVNRRSKPKVMEVKLIDLLKAKQGYTHKGLTGLVNLHNTCYQNTLVQCLRHLPSVATYFLKKQYSHFLMDREPKIIDEFAHTVDNLWLTDEECYDPQQFYDKVVQNIDELYGNGAHEDIHQFFLSLMEALVEDTQFKVFIDESAPPSTKSWYTHLNGYASFFSESFFHQTVTRQNCDYCNKRSVKYDMENVFMLSIPKEMEDQPFNLTDLMEIYLNGESTKRIRCKNCKAYVDNHQQILKFPKIAVVCIKRYKFEGSRWEKNEEPCYFPEEITINEHTYKLYSIAQHIGSLSSGHYTAICLNPIDQKWYLFNDTCVSRIGSVHDDDIYRKAYLLFYELKNQLNT